MTADTPELSAEQRRRYARQILLPEIGMAGQARLCAARVAQPLSGEAGAIASGYLTRAGVRVHGPEPECGQPESAPGPSQLPAGLRSAIVGSCDPYGALAPTLAALAGSLAATATIHALLRSPAAPASPESPE